ncbi:uncharacterized protein [Paramormyrops kingsleyae]|uniref:uncharacterized protein n=1 Tax=Paramormyrops kingsleyae TaxID=1676925 RepID=UPI003B96F5D9
MGLVVATYRVDTAIPSGDITRGTNNRSRAYLPAGNFQGSLIGMYLSPTETAVKAESAEVETSPGATSRRRTKENPEPQDDPEEQQEERQSHQGLPVPDTQQLLACEGYDILPWPRISPRCPPGGVTRKVQNTPQGATSRRRTKENPEPQDDPEEQQEERQSHQGLPVPDTQQLLACEGYDILPWPRISPRCPPGGVTRKVQNTPQGATSRRRTKENPEPQDDPEEQQEERQSHQGLPVPDTQQLLACEGYDILPWPRISPRCPPGGVTRKVQNTPQGATSRRRTKENPEPQDDPEEQQEERQSHQGLPVPDTQQLLACEGYDILPWPRISPRCPPGGVTRKVQNTPQGATSRRRTKENPEPQDDPEEQQEERQSHQGLPVPDTQQLLACEGYDILPWPRISPRCPPGGVTRKVQNTPQGATSRRRTKENPEPQDDPEEQQEERQSHQGLPVPDTQQLLACEGYDILPWPRISPRCPPGGVTRKVQNTPQGQSTAILAE